MYRGICSFDTHQSPQIKRPSLRYNQALLNTVTYDYDIIYNNIKLSNVRFSILSSCFNKINVWFITLFRQRFFKSTLKNRCGGNNC